LRILRSSLRFLWFSSARSILALNTSDQRVKGTASGRAVPFPGSSFDPLTLGPTYLKNQLGRELKLPRV
jgi:hypothetical protein